MIENARVKPGERCGSILENPGGKKKGGEWCGGSNYTTAASDIFPKVGYKKKGQGSINLRDSRPGCKMPNKWDLNISKKKKKSKWQWMIKPLSFCCCCYCCKSQIQMGKDWIYMGMGNANRNNKE